MSRVKTFDSTGVATSGRLYAGDLNSIQDQYADLSNLAQAVGVASLAVGESGLQIVRYGAGEARITGALRTDGIVRALGGLYAGAFTTTQRDAIGTGLAPYGIVILNTTTNRYEWNQGTDGARAWQPLGTVTTSTVGVLASRPAATAVASGSTYFATDQVVDYISDGTTWTRKSTPAGVTAAWHSNAGAPTGWVAYDGGNLPGSTGIYADLYAHLGNTLVTPDTRGRATYGQGTHTDVSAIGANDGVTVANRRPKHNHTNALALPDHTHGLPSVSYATDGGSGAGRNAVSQDGSGGNNGVPAWGGIGNPTTHPAPTGVIGPSGTNPLDSGPYIVALKIAKL